MWPKYFKENSVDFCVYWHQCDTRGRLSAIFFSFKRKRKCLEKPPKHSWFMPLYWWQCSFWDILSCNSAFWICNYLEKKTDFDLPIHSFQLKYVMLLVFPAVWINSMVCGKNQALTAPYRWVACKSGLIPANWGKHYKDVSLECMVFMPLNYIDKEISYRCIAAIRLRARNF